MLVVKIIRFSLLFIAGIFISLSGHSQNCVTCNSDTTLSTPGFVNLNSINCIVQGEPYLDTITLHMYTTLVQFGDTLTLDSVHLLDIENLPCGLCWGTSNSPLNTLLPNQNACIAISGTSTDTTGQFKLQIYFYAYFGRTAKAILPTTLDTDGIQLILRVVSPTGTCPPVDTSANAQNLLTSTTLCATAVNNIPGNISWFDVYPNPLNSDAMVSFTALQSGAYTLKLMDVAGRTLRLQQLPALAGINKADLLRQNLPGGIYFISIGNGQGMITKKLMVTE